MKILLLHTHYQFKGGEDAVFEQEYDLLAKTNQVKTLVFRNKDGWRGAIQFIFSIWNINSGIHVKRYILNFKPDVIHIHNWHYAAGPIIIRVAHGMGIPVVMTLHNYRLLCPSGSLMNNTQLFTDSLYTDFPWKAVKLRVFRDSFIQTFWLASVTWFHKKIGTWRMVNRYIALTNFAKELYISSMLGILPIQFTIKPNFTNSFSSQTRKRQSHFLYVGRLSDEKGVNILLSAFKHLPCTLSIAGEGPLLEHVKKTALVFSNITYLGNLDRVSVKNEMKVCSALIFPSIWYETFGMVVIESFAQGCPVIASNIGSPIELVQDGVNGLHFEAGNIAKLRDTLLKWNDLPEAVKTAYCYRACETYNRLYTPDANYQMLMKIYQSVIETSASSHAGKEPAMA